MGALSTDLFSLNPGQWYKFSSKSVSIPDELRDPYKVILKKNDPSDPDFGLCYLLSSFNLQLLEFRPWQLALGSNKLPEDVSVNLPHTAEITALEMNSSTKETALIFLKSLVRIRKNCLGYDPTTGKTVRSESLWKTFHPQDLSQENLESSILYKKNFSLLKSDTDEFSELAEEFSTIVAK